MKALYCSSVGCNLYKYILCQKNKMNELAQNFCFSNKCHRLHSQCKRNHAINNVYHKISQTVVCKSLPAVWEDRLVKGS